jgi:hypothetical protein
MKTENGTMGEHEKFRALGALANADALTPNEWAELQEHLQACESCRDAYREYRTLAREWFSRRAINYLYEPEPRSWNDTSTREKLFARVRAAGGRDSSESIDSLPDFKRSHPLSRISLSPLSIAWAAIAACLILVSVAGTGYRLGRREQASAKQDRASFEARLQKIVLEKKSVEELLGTQNKNVSLLQEAISQKEYELRELGSAMRAAEARTEETARMSSPELPSKEVSEQSDALNSQLRDAQQSYQNSQAELASLRAERDKALLQNASLESTVAELTATNREREQRARDDEQYLASDRDVRELMGARNLYIADVFDVDGRSRTRKPFGRIFYTQGKSLLFYAFDLDDQHHLKSADTFQAWGRSDTDKGKPLNLGIFYMDSESNRRWVLRFDDAEKVTEINAVFVTVEPHGGSRKPTSKPFLYALLRKEANHP